MSTAVVRPISNYWISQKWGLVNGFLVPGGVGGHPGTDYAAPTGQPIVACADGVVTFAGFANGFGWNCVCIWHPDLGVTSTSGHGQAHYVSYGQQVRAGQHVADCDSQGYATGPHLHFEIRPMNTPFGGNPPNIDSEAWLLLHLSGVLPNIPALTDKDRAAIKRMQYLLGLPQDGVWGPQTDAKLDTLRWIYLTPPRKPAVVGVIRSLQHDIYHFAAGDCDGMWGPKTDAAFLLSRLCWLNR